jgi:hypothetical protein
MGQRVLHLMGLLLGPVLSQFEFGVSLFLGQLQVVLLRGGKNGSARGLVLLLRGFKDFVEVDGLLIVCCLLKLTLLLLSLLLVNLLLNPLLLLLLLQLNSLFLH